MQDKDKKLFEDLETLTKLCKNHNLRDKFYDKLVDKTMELQNAFHEETLKSQNAYHEQTIKLQKIEKNNASFLKGVDKKTANERSLRLMKDKMLSQQSKMAIMGDMMDSVAHQWKQPLNSLTMLNDMLVDDFKDGIVDEAYIVDMTETSQMQISHMVNTLNEFRTFFRPSKESSDFFIKDCLDSVEILMKDELIKNNIVIKTDIVDNLVIYGQVNEFKHIFLNLLSNSKDAFNEKEITNRVINIRTYEENDNNIIEFGDNAQGIPLHVIADIFKPNVTTKETGKGTGIGLFMSSQIVQKHKGVISVSNNDSGAVFKIVIKK